MTKPLTKKQFRAMTRRFASGRCTVMQTNLGPDKGFAERWRPRVAGLNVHNADDPEDGFTTYDGALNAARRYRASCRAMLQPTRK